MPLRLTGAILLVVVPAGLSAAGVGAAGNAKTGFFKSPSGKIFCAWERGGHPSAAVLCGVATGLKPPIPKSADPAACKASDYVGNRVELDVTGRVRLVPCAGDAGPFADPDHTPYLRYGRSWSTAGLTCTSATTGITCRNRDRHGFFLSLRSWRTF
jgi:hypothetical protein